MAKKQEDQPKATYLVASPMWHGGDHYKVGELIELTQTEFEALPAGTVTAPDGTVTEETVKAMGEDYVARVKDDLEATQKLRDEAAADLEAATKLRADAAADLEAAKAERAEAAADLKAAEKAAKK